MIQKKIVLGVTALLFIFLIGCNTDAPAPPDPITHETLFEYRIGNTVIDPEEMNLVSFSNENSMEFQFLKDFNHQSFRESVSVSVFIENLTSGWKNNLTNAEIFMNGSLSFSNNEYGSVVQYNAFHPFDYLMILDPLGLCPGETCPGYFIDNGDEILVTVQFATANFEDSYPVSLMMDSFTCFASTETITRPVFPDDLDTGGFVESIKFSEYKIFDDRINVIPLGEVYDISLDFAAQLNPYKFVDMLDFRIVINNTSTNESFTLTKNVLAENGKIVIDDYVEGIVTFELENINNPALLHPATYFVLGGQEYFPATPGDLLEIEIDLFEGEDVLENEFKFQNKTFKLFYAGS